MTSNERCYCGAIDCYHCHPENFNIVNGRNIYWLDVDSDMTHDEIVRAAISDHEWFMDMSDFETGDYQ